MAQVTRKTMHLTEKAALENMKAKDAELRAMLDYNVMMGIIEDPTEGDDEDETF